MTKWLPFLVLPTLALAAEGPPAPQWNTANYSYLAKTKINTQENLNLRLFGSEKKILEMQQAYELKNRAYIDSERRGIASIYDRMAYEYNNSGFNNTTYTDMVNTVKQTQGNPYVQNVKAANDRGDFAEPVKYSAGALAVVTGRLVKADLGPAAVVCRLDLIRSTGSLDIAALGTKAVLTVNPRASEPYSASISRTLPYTGCNAGASYGSGSQIARIYVNRQIWGRVVGDISRNYGPSASAGQNEVAYRVNYGVSF